MARWNVLQGRPTRQAQLWSLVAAIWRPSEKRDPADWAAAHRIYPETAGIPGPRDPKLTPYMIPWSAAVHRGGYRRVVAVTSAQSGKTDSMLDIIGARLDQRPAPILYVGPTKEFLTDQFEPRLMALLDEAETLSNKVVRGRRMKKTLKHVTGVRLRLAHAGSSTALKSDPAALALIDEYDEMMANVKGQGDVLGLVFRGVAFEYRWKTRAWKPVWDVAFVGGSMLAALCQGIALGALVQGIEVEGRGYAGGWWDWLTPFSLLTGVAVVTGYALLGATWLVLKTEGALQHRMRRAAWPPGLATLGFMGLVSVITPFLEPVYFARWFNLPGSLFSIVMPVLVLAAAWALLTGLSEGPDARPFLAALSLFVLGFVGIGISFNPMMVPPEMTIWQAAAPRSRLAFALVGALILVPVILAYTGYAYWVFRGKVHPGDGYH